MNVNDRHRLERHARRIEELRLWRNAYEVSVGSWRFKAAEGKEQEISPGDFWPEISTPVRFSVGTSIPDDWSGLPVELELWLGGEGFVQVSNGDHQVSGGLNPFHRSYQVSKKARGGEDIQIDAEVVSKGVFGSNVAEPRLVRSSLVVPQTEVRALERDLSMISESCAALDDHEAVPLLLDVLDAAVASLSKGWPTATGTTLSRHLEGYVNLIGDGIKNLPDHYAAKALDIDRIGQETWSLPPAPEPLGPLAEEAIQTVRKAREIVAERLARVKERYPPVGEISLTGHAHLDLAWLWPVAETRRKGRRTFASVLGLMDRYEDFNFNQSSAQLYEWVEKDSPDLFDKVRGRIAEGRWETVGGSWVEPDCQIPSGESFTRQLLYGQKYFEEKFGRRSTVAWLPDTFGFSPGIPQLLRGAGLPDFFTYKLNWSETNKFPHDLFLWEGIDGSRVLAHSFENPGTDYNGDIAPLDMYGTWRNFRGKRNHPESLFSFGWGDGGGGPSEKMLENYARLKDFPAMPRLNMGRVDEFFAAIPREGLPKWVGELYLELHRGTLTTQARVKKLNREGEHRLMEAEALSTLAALRGYEYPGDELERLWKVLLLNQFHDILPGTSISEVYEDTHRELEEVVNGAKKLRERALQYLSEGDETGDKVFVANTALHPRSVTVTIPADSDSSMSVLDAEGEPLPAQQTADGILVHAPDHRVHGLGCINLRLENPGTASPPKQAGVRVEEAETRTVIENDLLRVEIGGDGSLDRVYDREMEREVLDGRGNRLVVYTDKPAQWDAWDVQEGYELEGGEIPGPTKVEVVEDGPLRVSVRVERRWRDSSIVQTYRLLSGSRRLDIETDVDWHERQVLLRTVFPLNVRSHEATFETMFGVVKRPTHQNTSWDAARFEVCGHRFADLSESGYGAALLNDGKYGHSVKDNVLGISLLRSPLYPDPFADEGEHHFTYSLYPHPGGWAEGGVADAALDLNSPLIATTGSLPETDATSGFLTLDGVKLALGSLKMAEDGRGVILRLYEPHGARGRCALRFANRVESAERVNLLEEPEGDSVEVEGDAVRLDVKPFEAVTLRLNLENG